MIKHKLGFRVLHEHFINTPNSRPCNSNRLTIPCFNYKKKTTQSKCLSNPTAKKMTTNSQSTSINPSNSHKKTKQKTIQTHDNVKNKQFKITKTTRKTRLPQSTTAMRKWRNQGIQTNPKSISTKCATKWA